MAIKNTVSMKKKPIGERIRKNKYLLLMCIPFVIWAIIFFYIPLYGWLMAFQNYNPGIGLFSNNWVGMKYFQRFFHDPQFGTVMRNTVALGAINIVNFTIWPVVFALLLNELRNIKIKKSIQTISYLPHFVSYVVVANLFLTLLSPSGGVVNELLVALGITKESVHFFAKPKAWWFIIAFINIWKDCGWSAIVYLAAISSIDPLLYEAAAIDGAGRLRQIWNITLPGIVPTIVILLILSVPDLLNAGFEPSFLLGNSIVSDHSEVLDLFIYNKGIKYAQFSYATAIGIMRTLLGLILVLGANKFAKSVSDYGIL